MAMTSCNQQEKIPFEDLKVARGGEVNRPSYSDLDRLESDSDLIIVGTCVGEAEQRDIYQYDGHFDENILVMYNTLCNVEIKQVFKGDVEVGDTISVCQQYGVDEEEGKFWTFSNLTPMIDGDTWLFFLYDNRGENYMCCGDEDGRYPILNNTYRKMALTGSEELGVLDKNCFNERIYAEILINYEFE
ncbi:MAG: hypothetical protein NC203_06300 [Firmicutes bacterium]|nr:hypothetical protein [[Eubacterium] siraeum]MCM1487957.1 hypothetical protein [Bacillota bacterium]